MFDRDFGAMDAPRRTCGCTEIVNEIDPTLALDAILRS